MSFSPFRGFSGRVRNVLVGGGGGGGRGRHDLRSGRGGEEAGIGRVLPDGYQGSSVTRSGCGARRETENGGM